MTEGKPWVPRTIEKPHNETGDNLLIDDVDKMFQVFEDGMRRYYRDFEMTDEEAVRVDRCVREFKGTILSMLSDHMETRKAVQCLRRFGR